jgi:hypothetical protein
VSNSDSTSRRSKAEWSLGEGDEVPTSRCARPKKKRLEKQNAVESHDARVVRKGELGGKREASKGIVQIRTIRQISSATQPLALADGSVNGGKLTVPA